MEIGEYIVLDLDVWINDIHVLKSVKSKIIDLCHDPLKRHESKCGVEINGEGYGIPFSEVKQVFPADGEQLKLL